VTNLITDSDPLNYTSINR